MFQATWGLWTLVIWWHRWLSQEHSYLGSPLDDAFLGKCPKCGLILGKKKKPGFQVLKAYILEGSLYFVLCGGSVSAMW